MIYLVSNFVTNIITYVCTDQALIDEGQAKKYTGNFVIGSDIEAKSILASSQQEYLQTISNLFSVNKDIDPDPIQTTWVVCDLNTEQPNTDIDYNVFDVLNGYYNIATGLDNAKSLLNQTKQTYLDSILVIARFNSWADVPKLIVPNTTVQGF